VEPLRADRVVIARGVLADPKCRARLDAMLPRVETPRVDVLDDDAVEAELVELGTRQGRPRGGQEGLESAKALVAFARFGDGREVFPGYSWRERRDGRAQAREHGVLCQTAIEIQSVVGCPFDCAYCPYTSFVCVRLDVETYADRVVALVKERPSQTLWKLSYFAGDSVMVARVMRSPTTIVFTTSIPAVTFPKTVYFPSSEGCAASVT
jgi:hypothetical protein